MKSLRVLIASFYRLGYDKITVKGDFGSEIGTIIEKQTSGFSITSQDQSSVTIESLIQTNEEHLDKTLKRLFFLLNESLVTKDRKQLHSEITTLENLFRKTLTQSSYGSELVMLYWQLSFELKLVTNELSTLENVYPDVQQLFQKTYSSFLKKDISKLVLNSDALNVHYQDLLAKVSSTQDYHLTAVVRYLYLMTIPMIAISSFEK